MKRNLVRHQKLHGQINRIACPNNNCSATFTQVGDLKSHERNMHENKVKYPLKLKLALVENTYIKKKNLGHA